MKQYLHSQTIQLNWKIELQNIRVTWMPSRVQPDHFLSYINLIGFDANKFFRMPNIRYRANVFLHFFCHISNDLIVSSRQINKFNVNRSIHFANWQRNAYSAFWLHQPNDTMFHSSADARLTSTVDFIIETRPCYQISKPLHFSSSFDIVRNCLLSIRIDSYLRMWISALPLIILLIILLIAVPSICSCTNAVEIKKAFISMRTEFNWKIINWLSFVNRPTKETDTDAMNITVSRIYTIWNTL